MKKLTTVLMVTSLTAVLSLASGCSSAPAQMAASDTTISDPSASDTSAIPTAPDAGMIAESAPAVPGTLMADNSAMPSAPLTLSDAAPAAMIPAAARAASPVNLGASSAGRAY